MRTIGVQDLEGLEEFLAVATTLNAGDPTWVAPLAAPQRLDLTGRSAFGRYGRQQLFLCVDGAGRALGRIAAIVNPRLPGVGQVGYFEAVDDDEVARCLLDAATAWLTGQGFRRCIGPMQGGAHRPHRFMVAGFERPPFLLEPRNPPHYPRLFERQGFVRAHTWRSWELTTTGIERLARWAGRLSARTGADEGYAVDELDPHELTSTLSRLHRLLDRAWRGHLGYTPLESDELVEGFAGLLAIMPERHVGVVVDESGRDVGFGFMFPDWVEQVRDLRGDASGWGRWFGTTPLPPRIIMSTFALVPAARHTGAAHRLLGHAADCALAHGYREAVLALATEDLGSLRRHGEPTREYALFERSVVGR